MELHRYDVVEAELKITDKCGCIQEVMRKFGIVRNKTHRNLINKVCFNTFFYGEDINWEEVLK